jgi:hypothetical protein
MDIVSTLRIENTQGSALSTLMKIGPALALFFCCWRRWRGGGRRRLIEGVGGFVCAARDQRIQHTMGEVVVIQIATE